MLNILWRNLKWRFQNPFSLIIILLQPLLWLLLYSAIASQTMGDMGIDNYTAFLLPGIVVLVIFSASGSGGILNYLMKKNGGYYRILIAPVKRSTIVLGQLFETVIVVFIEVAVLFFIGFFFSVKIAAGWLGVLLILLLVFLTAFFVSSIVYLISLIFPNEVIYETVMNALVLPIFFLSSALFPVENLSGFLKAMVMINPFTHVINSFRSLVLEPVVSWETILPVISLFFIFGWVSFLLAKRQLRKQLMV